MSWFTKQRNKVTGAVQGVVNTGLGLLGSTGLGGLAGLIGGGLGGALPSPGMGQMQSIDGTGGYQNNLETLMAQMGQQQPQVSQTGTTSGGGLI